MKRLFEEIYDGVMETANSFFEAAASVVETLVRFGAIITIPLWIIPYMMIKHKEERENE